MMDSAGKNGRSTRHGGRRVLIIIENLPLPFDRRAWHQATTLKDSGYEVSVICPTGKGHWRKFEVCDGVHIYRHNLPVDAAGAMGYVLEYGAALFWQFVLAWRVFLTRGFDAIQACNPPDNIFLIGGFFKFVFRRKFIFDHRDINPELYEAKFGRRDRLYALLVALERWTYRCADVVIATNESYRKIAIERGGVDADRIFIVRSGPRLDKFKIMPPVPALKRGRKYLVGYVGVMGQQEGLHLVLEAVRHIVHDMGRKDIHFGLVGDGPALESLKRLAAEINVAEYVTFTGRVPDKELLEMLNTADLCVNSDEYNEMNDKSTMNKIMEYMALGKPIVQFDLTEGRVSAQDASVYARPNDAIDMAEKIVALLDDPEERARMGAFGRRRIEDELAWTYEVPKLLAAYDKLWA